MEKDTYYLSGKKAIWTFSVLTVAFLLYSFSIYTAPVFEPDQGNANTGNIAAGKLVWQKYNCQSCHQIFGLGGYLGPDLTNILSQPGKTDVYILAMIKSGTAQMPPFELTGEESARLIDYLQAVNASGKASPEQFKVLPNGMIEQK